MEGARAWCALMSSLLPPLEEESVTSEKSRISSSSSDLLDFIEARWGAEVGSTLPEIIKRRWLGFLRSSGIPPSVLLLAVSLTEIDLLGNPLSCMDQLARAQRAANQGLDAELLLRARAYVAERGWPTGVRFQRAVASGSYVADALGHDVPEYVVPGAKRPDLLSIAVALSEPTRR